MIPKDKALELFYKFSKEVSRGFKSDSFTSATIAKQCALIAVDEIIKVCTFVSIKNRNISEQFSVFDYKFIDYWEEVKSEIEKL